MMHIKKKGIGLHTSFGSNTHEKLFMGIQIISRLNMPLLSYLLNSNK